MEIGQCGRTGRHVIRIVYNNDAGHATIHRQLTVAPFVMVTML